jgi:peptidyl-prolyl cis-trans isomerase C
VAATPPGSWDGGGAVLAVVDGENVTDAMLRAELARAQREDIARFLDASAGADTLEKMARAQAIYHRAVARKLHEDPEVRARLIMAQREVLMQALLDQIGDDAATDAAIRRAYASHRADYAIRAARMRVMFLPDAAAADAARRRLEAGADFAALAKELSIDQGTAAKGGDVGWVVKGQLLASLDDVLFGVDRTGLVGPLPSGDVSVLFSVEARRDVTPIEEVWDQLREQVRQQAIDAFLASVEDDVRVNWIAGHPPDVQELTAPAGADARP